MSKDKTMGLVMGDPSKSEQNAPEEDFNPQFSNESPDDAMQVSTPKMTVFEERQSYHMSDIGSDEFGMESLSERRQKHENEIFRLVDQEKFAKRQILWHLCEIYNHREAFFTGEDKGYRSNFTKYLKDTFGQKTSTLLGDAKVVMFLVEMGKVDILKMEHPDLITVLKRIAHAPKEHQKDLLEDIQHHDRTSISTRIKEIRNYGKGQLPSNETFVLPDDFIEDWGMADIEVDKDSVRFSLAKVPIEKRKYYLHMLECYAIDRVPLMMEAFFRECKVTFEDFEKLSNSLKE
jgi:hypothetical protein